MLDVVIPAATQGDRMYTSVPRPLIETGRGTLVSRQVAALRATFKDPRIMVVVGYEADRVISNLPEGVLVVENENFATTGAVRSASLGLRALGSKSALIVSGDLLFNSVAIAPLTKRGSCLLADSGGRIAREEAGIRVVDGRVIAAGYEYDLKWGLVAYLEGRAFDLFREYALDKVGRNAALHEAIDHMAAFGGRIRAAEPEGAEFLEIDTSRDIWRARESAL